MAFFESYNGGAAPDVIAMLNALYASERIASEQYYRHSVDVTGIWSTSIADMFAEHATEENSHADTLRDLIDNLGGTISNKLSTMIRANPHHSGDGDVQSSMNAKEMLQQDLEAESTAIEAYTEVLNKVHGGPFHHVYIALAEILGDEYHHRRELNNLLVGFEG